MSSLINYINYKYEMYRLRIGGIHSLSVDDIQYNEDEVINDLAIRTIISGIILLMIIILLSYIIYTSYITLKLDLLNY